MPRWWDRLMGRPIVQPGGPARRYLNHIRAQQPEVDRLTSELEARRNSDNFRAMFEQTIRGDMGEQG